MSRQMTVAIAGLGSRGRDTYAKAAKMYPDKMKIVAIADIDPEKVKLTAEEYDVPMSHCYESAEDMLKEEKLADAMIIATQDRQHVGQAIKALKKGYHLLLEKPISPDLGECRKISEVAKECKREVVVCHVLRYTPIYQKVKEILDAGMILSRLVDTFFSRISPTMQLPPKHHSIAYVLPWAEGLHWQSRSSGCSNS